jgi:hypothetical protein
VPVYDGQTPYGRFRQAEPPPPPPPVRALRHTPCPQCRLFLLVRHCWVIFHDESIGCDTLVCVGCKTRVAGERSWQQVPTSPLFEPMDINEGRKR